MNCLNISKIALALAVLSLAACHSANDLCDVNGYETPVSKDVPDNPSEGGEGGKHEALQGEDRIESDIHWYALENEGNADYWNQVNCDKVWIEMAIGKTLEDPNIAPFLGQYGLSSIFRQSANPQATNYYIFDLPGGTPESVLEIVKAGKQVEGILFIEPQNNYSNNFTPNDEWWDYQWGPYVIWADEAWNLETGNSWNVVAVIDDACDYTHSDLANQVWYGWDYGFNDADPYPDNDSQIHGTHVTGTIAASINNSIGIAGMVNDTVYFAKVTDATYDPQFGNFSDAAIVDALYDIASIDRVGVVNMSLGGGTPSAALEQACNAAYNAGKLLCVASGNDGTNVIAYPAAFDACMAVGSIGTDGFNMYLADYSQYGNQQEVVAPGGDLNTGYGILSTVPGDQYDYLQGTSMACPHVTGLAGLMMASNPNLNNSQVRQKIWESCIDYGDAGWDPVFGYGMIHALNGVILEVSETEDNRLELSAEVFPNPVADHVQVQRENADEQWIIDVYNLQGQLVESQLFPQGSLTTHVEMSQLNSGVYIMKISIGNRASKSVRLIKS
ncbi:MAG: S8 family peptidase [Flavobacteriales bacterium]|nr:S8 family peptidase [Flavobacteriales bacterium]